MATYASQKTTGNHAPVVSDQERSWGREGTSISIHAAMKSAAATMTRRVLLRVLDGRRLTATSSPAGTLGPNSTGHTMVCEGPKALPSILFMAGLVFIAVALLLRKKNLILPWC